MSPIQEITVICDNCKIIKTKTKRPGGNGGTVGPNHQQINVEVLEGLREDVSCQNLFCSLNGGCEAEVMAVWLRMKCLRENRCFGQ